MNFIRPSKALLWFACIAINIQTLTTITAVLLLVYGALTLVPQTAQAQNPPKRVLVLYWDNKDYPGNIKFDESFKAVLQHSAFSNAEYYSEYFESSRFPGEAEALSFRDYLREKYAARNIDVVVATADPPLNFLLKYRAELFPNSPIVFVANQPPASDRLRIPPGLTGIINQSTHGQTLELALKLHPDTRYVFVISGSPEHDKRFEAVARQALQGFENRVEITYLTDLPLGDLIARTASLPKQSIALYVWQRRPDEEGKQLETYEVVGRFSRTASVPIYGMSAVNLGYGIVGGYLVGPETNGAKSAELATRILIGTRAQDIPVESAPAVPMFDWRQLKRWGIGEERLPSGSIVRFRTTSLWQQYKAYVIGAIAMFIIQTGLIAWLLLERNKRQRAEVARRHLAAIVESSDDAIIGGTLDGQILSWNPGAERLYGYAANEVVGRNLSFIHPPDRPKELDDILKRLKAGENIMHFETVRVRKDGTHVHVSLSISVIKDRTGRSIAAASIARDISERKQAEQELQRLTNHLLTVQDDERRRLALELHDVTAQNLFAINMNLSRLQRGRVEPAEVQEIIDESRTLGHQSLQEIRTLSYLLHPPMLDQSGLIDALKWYVDGFVKRSGIDVEVLSFQDIGRLPSELETALFRIVQEGLTNIKRHSGSSSANIKLEKQDGHIVLQIRDYGHGLPAKTSRVESNGEDSPGVGIPGMRQRLRQFSGDLRIESNDRGTLLTAIVPLANGADHDSNSAG